MNIRTGFSTVAAWHMQLARWFGRQIDHEGIDEEAYEWLGRIYVQKKDGRSYMILMM